MLYKTHLAAGLCAGLAVAAQSGGDAGLIAAASGVGALLPDIDCPRSYIGRKVPVSYAAYLGAGHRGFFHSLASAIVITFIALVLLRKWVPAYTFLWVPLAAGYLSHLLMDTLNPSGVPWLWPLNKRFTVPLINTGSVWEKLLITYPLYLVLLLHAVPYLRKVLPGA
ncbi:metal-dependent hydrolase [Moorellaceae bacterium AZ2]